MTASDADLVVRAWRGDSRAFDELLLRHRGALVGIALRFTGDVEVAADLAQDAAVRIYSRLGQLRDPARFRPWALSVVRSACANRVHAEALRRGLEGQRPPEWPALEPAAEEASADISERRRVREAVRKLPEPYGPAMERHYLRGESVAEVSRELGAPVGTVKSWLHHARRTLRERMTDMSQDWLGECEWPAEREPTVSLEELAEATLRRYDLGDLGSLGSVYEPSQSLAIGVETDRGRYRLWRYHGLMAPDHIHLQHAMLKHLDERDVPVKRLVPARDGSTWLDVNGHLVALFGWFSGAEPDLRNRRDLAQVAELHAKWTLAMAEFDPGIPGWRELASAWRPRKDWAWALPTEQLPLVPRRMGFFAAVRDLADPPAHHETFLEQVRGTEARLERFADVAEELGLDGLPRGVNHGVFLFGRIDWGPMVTDGDDFQYEARIGDLGRLIFALHDRELADYQLEDRLKLVLDTYCAHVDLSPAELRALPLYAWGQFLHYDTFHVLLYLIEQSSPDRGEYLACRNRRAWASIRDRWEERMLKLSEDLGGR